MRQYIKIREWIFKSFCTGILLLVACGCVKQEEDGETDIVPGVVNDGAGFQIAYQDSDDAFEFDLHKGKTTMDEPCVIYPDSTDKDIVCYLDAEELDLYFN